MHVVPSTLVLLMAAASASNAVNTSDKSVECIDGLYIVVARATGEPPGPGESGRIANRVADRISGSKIVALDYPAKLVDPLYTDSQRKGQVALKAVLEDYVAKCPDGKFAAIGYSQGAHLTDDIICGTSGGIFSKVEPIDLKIIQNNMIAGIFFGDPTHVKGSKYSIGTSPYSGIWNRKSTSVDRCDSLSDRVRSYCNKGDAFCDKGSVIEDKVHNVYVNIYGDEVVDYITQRWKNATGNSPRQESADSIMRWGGPNSATYNQASQTADEKGNDNVQNNTNTINNDKGNGKSSDDDESAAAGLQPISSLANVWIPLILFGLFHVL